MLLRNTGRVLTRMQLIDRVWGSDYVGDTKTLDVHVKRLRAKIEPDPADPRHIVTVRGLGYKFEARLTRQGVAVVVVVALGTAVGDDRLVVAGGRQRPGTRRPRSAGRGRGTGR